MKVSAGPCSLKALGEDFSLPPLPALASGVANTRCSVAFNVSLQIRALQSRGVHFTFSFKCKLLGAKDICILFRSDHIVDGSVIFQHQQIY